jgi:membrane-bound serine protease (ClpP class)
MSYTIFPGVAVTVIRSAAAALLLLASTILASPSDSQLVIHARIEGMIDGGISAYVSRVIETAEADSADAIVFEMNTYGGRVDAADAIRLDILDTDILTITWIHGNAASAGALISLATDTIAMSPASAIGAATPVMGTTGKTASRKMVSYFRAIMGTTARATGRDPRIAEAMVDSAVTVPGMEDASRPLTLRTDQALALKIAQQQVSNMEDVLRLNGLEGARVTEIRSAWAEEIVRFLTNPMISGLLMTIGALGIIYELTSPGFGMAGTAGVVCLVLFFGSHWVIKLAQLPELIMFIAGVALVVAEIFVPGGVLGIIGALVIVASLLLAMLPKIDFVMRDFDLLRHALIAMGGAVLLTFAGAIALIRSLAEMPIFRGLMLSKRQKLGTGVPVEREKPRSELLGAEGVSETPLRPAGRARINKRYLDVTTEGEHIEAGVPVKVVHIDGIRIVVTQV